MRILYRNPNKGYIGGVCHGLGVHTNVDPILWRMFFLFGMGLPIYILLWMFVNKEPCIKE